jgi:hypothetical protein
MRGALYQLPLVARDTVCPDSICKPIDPKEIKLAHPDVVSTNCLRCHSTAFQSQGDYDLTYNELKQAVAMSELRGLTKPKTKTKLATYENAKNPTNRFCVNCHDVHDTAYYTTTDRATRQRTQQESLKIDVCLKCHLASVKTESFAKTHAEKQSDGVSTKQLVVPTNYTASQTVGLLNGFLSRLNIQAKLDWEKAYADTLATNKGNIEETKAQLKDWMGLPTDASEIRPTTCITSCHKTAKSPDGESIPLSMHSKHGIIAKTTALSAK